MTEINNDPQSQQFIKRIEHLEQHLAEFEAETKSKTVELGKQFFSLQSFLKELSLQWESNEELYTSLVNWIGYALLSLSLFYNISLVIPFRLMDYYWEIQTIASLIDNIPMLLLGLVFAFYGKLARKKPEKFILNIASWACLLIGILFFLLIPLGIADTLRINNQNYLQSSNQLSQQTTQLQNFKDKLNNANSPEEITKFIGKVSPGSPALNTSKPQELKQKILSQVTKAEEVAKTQIEIKQKQQQLDLFKNSIRYLLGALVCGALFIYAWRITFLILKFVMH